MAPSLSGGASGSARFYRARPTTPAEAVVFVVRFVVANRVITVAGSGAAQRRQAPWRPGPADTAGLTRNGHNLGRIVLAMLRGLG